MNIGEKDGAKGAARNTSGEALMVDHKETSAIMKYA